MASKKVSALTALTTAGSDDLIYIADTSDSGSSYASKKITVGNFLNGYATQSYVTTQINNVIDSAPSALDTLNELAAALNDDANFSATVTGLIDANETHIDNVATLTGLAKDSTSLGTFTGSTIADSSTIKAALQALETSLETKGSAGSITSVSTNVGDLVILSGVAQNAEDLGTFTGATIADNVTIKAALQALETALEAADSLADLGVTSTAAELNVLDGITATTAELNLLDGVTSTTAELNILDGVTASATEINLLDGVTATTAELNILDGVTSTAAELNILDGVTASAAEINLLDGVTATTAELNYVDGVTSAIQTQIDGKVATGANVNTLVGSTSAGTVPTDSNGDDNYLFLVINKANGALVAIDKTFLEAEG